MNKFFPLLLVPIILTGCEVMHRPGIVVKDRVAFIKPDGTKGEKLQDLITINGDAPGLSEVPTSRGPIKFRDTSQTTVVAVTDPKTGVTTTTTNTRPGGLYVSEHVAVRGEADKSRAKEFWSGVSGAALSWGAALFAGGFAPGAGGAVSNLTKP